MSSPAGSASGGTWKLTTINAKGSEKTMMIPTDFPKAPRILWERWGQHCRNVERLESIPAGELDYCSNCTSRDEYTVSTMGRAAVSDYMLRVRRRVRSRLRGGLPRNTPGSQLWALLAEEFGRLDNPRIVKQLARLAKTPDATEETSK